MYGMGGREGVWDARTGEASDSEDGSGMRQGLWSALPCFISMLGVSYSPPLPYITELSGKRERETHEMERGSYAGRVREGVCRLPPS